MDKDLNNELNDVEEEITKVDDYTFYEDADDCIERQGFILDESSSGYVHTNDQNKTCGIVDKRQSQKSLLPIETLPVFLCCTFLCLGSIALEDLSLARDHFQQKSQRERSQYILDTIMLNSGVNSECTFYIGNTKVCLAAWRSTLGISSSSFYNIKKQVTDGKKVIHTNGRPIGSVEMKTQFAFVWLKDFCNTYAGVMPDSNQLHLPCCLTRTSVYEMMTSDLCDINEDCISLSHFLMIWRKDLKHIAIPKRSRFSECTICSLIKKELSETRDKRIRAGLLEQRNGHLKQQRAEREKYYKHQMKARKEPDKYLSIIIDAMDQSRTMLPHFAKPPKSTDGMWKLKTHLLAAKVHGIGVYGFFDVFQWPHGSNLTITSLMNILLMLKDSLPEVLYLQMDNCGRENKNRFVLAFLCLLVELRVFTKIKLSFLMKGHTHEDIDQVFSRFSVWLNRNDSLTMEELMKGLEDSYTPNPTAIQQLNVFNFSDWIGRYTNPLAKHSQPHVFKIYNDNGKARIVCKKWSTDKVYTECVGSEKYFLHMMPTDAPILLTPIYHELDRVKDSLPNAQKFMKQKQLDWWTNFFIEKEDEEANFHTEGYEFPLFDLAKFVNEVRQKRAHNLPPVEIPQIVNNDEEMEPVVIGKVQKPLKKERRVVEGLMALTDLDKYADEWPQVGKIVELEEESAKIHWYKGSKTGQWNPCSVPVPGHRGKRMPWLEMIPISDIWMGDFRLTSKNCLPKYVKEAIDNYCN